MELLSVFSPIPLLSNWSFKKSRYWLIFCNHWFVIFRLLLSKRQTANRSFPMTSAFAFFGEKEKNQFSQASLVPAQKSSSGTPHLTLSSLFLLQKHKLPAPTDRSLPLGMKPHRAKGPRVWIEIRLVPPTFLQLPQPEISFQTGKM